jgi:biopolymer transport protein ExbB
MSNERHGRESAAVSDRSDFRRRFVTRVNLACWLLVAASVTAHAAESDASTAVSTAVLPRDLSPWGMFLSADIVVKAVMIGLAFASVVTWTVWLTKTIELIGAKRQLRAGLRVLDRAGSLTDPALLAVKGPAANLRAAAITEMRLSADARERDGLKERIASRLERIEAGCARRISRGTGVLATIGATAPFVGLFGTVWGIMNSFIGISKSHTTNLAIVAPGIAEALLATAFGLAAAIPAVVIYNVFSRSIAGYRALLGDTDAAVMRLASRDLDRAGPHGSVIAPAAE